MLKLISRENTDFRQSSFYKNEFLCDFDEEFHYS